MLVVAATEAELAATGARDTLCCGIGPVETAATVAAALASARPNGVLHVGLAGERGFTAPEVVIGDEALYCDAVTPGFVRAQERPDGELLGRVRTALPGARVLTIGTSARVGGSSGCTIEAMEGFAVLRACALAGVPAVEVRVVVNEVEEPDRSRWRFDDGFRLLGETVPLLLEALDA